MPACAVALGVDRVEELITARLDTRGGAALGIADLADLGLAVAPRGVDRAGARIHDRPPERGGPERLCVVAARSDRTARRQAQDLCWRGRVGDQKIQGNLVGAVVGGPDLRVAIVCAV